LAELLLAASAQDLFVLSDKIEKTLSAFAAAHPENEEQIFKFGTAMRSLKIMLEGRAIPSFRAHPDRDVTILFAGGFYGLSFDETVEQLRAERVKRRNDYQSKLQDGRRREHTLVQDIKEAVASIVPPQRPEDR
jgi:hypothetical protein